jgi:hypothetical protein
MKKSAIVVLSVISLAAAVLFMAQTCDSGAGSYPSNIGTWACVNDFGSGTPSRQVVTMESGSFQTDGVV